MRIERKNRKNELLRGMMPPMSGQGEEGEYAKLASFYRNN
jgi:hypothetical protein